MSYRNSLAKYVDNAALRALPALTWVFEWRQNSWDLVIQISKDQCAFSGALMSTELEVSIEKKDKVFSKKTTIIFCKREMKIISRYKGNIPYLLSSY